jgi:hypothetical protein
MRCIKKQLHMLSFVIRVFADVYRFSVGKIAGKKAFGRRRQRCKDNVNMDRREISRGGRMD